jgi:hypothetical protein
MIKKQMSKYEMNIIQCGLIRDLNFFTSNVELYSVYSIVSDILDCYYIFQLWRV